MSTGSSIALQSIGIEPVDTLQHLNALNAEQRKAVLHTEGPLLVLAGAGTGKTRVLTTRIAHILSQKLAFPYQILSVTFTNKAAHEMRERISLLLGRPVDDMWIGTFHSLAVRILRRHAEKIGLKSNFTILDSDDQLRLIKQIIKSTTHVDKELSPKDVQHRINKLKDKGFLPDRARDVEDPLVCDIYQDYQERLITLNAADFGDLLLHNLTLFKDHPTVLQHYQNQFKYLFVDEYQDTNTTQYLWIRLIAKGSGNVCCVGDDDQSIYGWRGAEVGNILRFEKDFPGSTLIRLEQNYRSTAPILKAASGLISHNNGRYGKTLWTDKTDGEPIQIRACYDGDHEARCIGEEIERLQSQKNSLNTMAILVRATFQTLAFEECFMQLGIPYRVIGGLRFYERLEVRDCLAYLRFLSQPDDALAFERIINIPKRGIGDTTIQRLHTFARSQGISLPTAARFAAEQQLEDVPIQKKARAALCQFFLDFDRWRALLETQPFVDVIKTLLDESGYTGMWLLDKTPESTGRLENIKEFVQALTQFESLVGFLEHVSLVLDTNNNSDDEMVTLMTLHGAKGLEFDTVFLAGWEEGLFPHPRSFSQEYNIGIEEERRLAYVGISRARKRSIISYAYRRRAPQGWQMAQPSRFIYEIPQDITVHFAPTGSPIEKKNSSGINDFGGSFNQSKSISMYPISQNKQAKKDSISLITTHSFKTGENVFHEKFGDGKVIAFEGDKLLIQFPELGVRKIIANFVSRAKNQ